jgi:CheY-like chemotaxis protein
MLDDSLEGVRRISAIVSELRQLAHLAPGNIESVSLNEVVSAATRLVRSRIKQTCVLHERLGESVALAADRGKLVQVAVNLLTNAADAVSVVQGPARIIRVTTASTDVRVSLVVEDSGQGVPDAERRRIFEPFFTTKPRRQGTGLGLSLSAEYVQRHGGEIRVDVSPLGGAWFEVILPRHTGLVVTAPGPIGAPVRPSSEKLRVLVVDDEPGVLRAYHRVLRGACEVEAVGSGREALDVLGRSSVDVIVCDVSMPEMDGCAFYEHVCQHQPELADRFIFCSGGALTKNTRLFLERHSHQLLAKPVHPSALLDFVLRVGEGRAPVEETRSGGV